MRNCGVDLVALLLMIALGGQTAAAQATMAQATITQVAADCPGDPGIDYNIELNIDIPEPRLHHDLSIAELNRLALRGPGHRVLGLAVTGLEFSWAVGFQWQPQGAGHCFWVRRTKLAIRQPSPDIYVAREYRRSSCAYQAVLAHERRHMTISREQINRYLPRLQWVLTSLRIPTAERPIYVTSAEAAKTEVRALMKSLAEPLFQEMNAALRTEQAKLDSPASYRRLRKKCRRW